MNKDKKFINDVIKILELGEYGSYTKEELEIEFKKSNIDTTSVHVYGSRGLLERNNSDGKYWLGLHGLELLLTHRSIKQAKKYSNIALWFSGISSIFAFFALIVNIITLLR